MTSSSLLTMILASAVVSTIVGFVLRYVFENRQKHHFEMQLENLKHTYEMQIATLKARQQLSSQLQSMIVEARTERYHHLAALLEQAFDRADGLVHTWYNPDFDWDTEFGKFGEAISALEAHIRECRLQLEQDGMYGDLIRYLFKLREFRLDVPDLETIRPGVEGQRREPEVFSGYEELGRLNVQLVKKLCAKMAVPEVSEGQDDGAQ